MLTENQFNYIEDLVIPAGLSFYTFQSISYTIDVYRGSYAPDRKVGDFLLFVSFFPHMVAGPVMRHKDLMPQIKRQSWLNEVDWSGFARLVTWGYFKKLVIADNLNLLVTPVFNNVTDYSGGDLILAGFLFVVQVYCDFSGYSDIATGVARLFNIRLSLNWKRPLFSKSLHEFWQRNHISITTWFRDYLYIGLGGNRVSYVRWLFNIFLVFLISGLWHGANFTFVVWGAMHGVFYVLEILLRKKFPTIKIPSFFGWMYLITFHTVSLIAFRALDLTDLVYIYGKIFSFGSEYTNMKIFDLQDRFFYLVQLFALLVLIVKEFEEEYGLIKRKQSLYEYFTPLAYSLLIVFLFIFGNFNANTFIYFQF